MLGKRLSRVLVAIYHRSGYWTSGGWLHWEELIRSSESSLGSLGWKRPSTRISLSRLWNGRPSVYHRICVYPCRPL